MAFKVQTRTVNSAGTRREWKDLTYGQRFNTEQEAWDYIDKVFLNDPQSDFLPDEFRVRLE